MKPARDPFLAWPGWPHFGRALVQGTAVALWWVLVYGGCDYLTGQRTFRVRVYLDAELAMPFVPGMVVFYLSIYPLFWLAPFVLRTRRELTAYNWTLVVVILTAGIGFLLFPADLAFAPAGDAGIWTGLLDTARRISLHYNLAPSLHVGLTVTCVAIYARRAALGGKVLLWTWAGAVAASTLLTHQHHVVDVVSGWLLGVGGGRFLFPRLIKVGLGRHE
jgi:membrane-associated phospholipid phosphatase